MVKVLVVEYNKEPYIANVDDKLQSYQAIVGGLIECVNIEVGVDLVVNEEGKINGMELNRFLWGVGIPDAVYGTFFIVGVDESVGMFQSLTDSQIKKYQRIFRL